MVTKLGDEFLGHTAEEWEPMPPDKGPPLPKWMEIYWPWYKPEALPTVYTCPICGATFSTQEELNQHIQTVHPTAPPVADIRLSNLVISPTELNIGEKVTISVTATNQGSIAGTKTISCTVS